MSAHLEPVQTPADSKGSASQRIAQILESICGLADTVRHLGICLVGDDEFDVQKAVAVRELAGQIGLLAALGLAKFGSAGCKGDAEAWLLPPVDRAGDVGGAA